VNLEVGEWLIPPESAKTAKPHIVYLSTQVVEMFRELKALAGDSELVLPGRGMAQDRKERKDSQAAHRLIVYEGCRKVP